MTPRQPWTKEDDEYLTKHYPHTTTEQLSRIMRRPVKAIISHANAMLGLRKASPVPKAKILALASRPEGMRSTDLVENGNVPERYMNWCCDMARDGKLFRYQISYRNVRYFATQELADAFAKSYAKPAKAPSVTIKHQPGRAWWPKDAEPIITKHTKFSVGPSFKEDSMTTRKFWGPNA